MREEEDETGVIIGTTEVKRYFSSNVRNGISVRTAVTYGCKKVTVSARRITQAYHERNGLTSTHTPIRADTVSFLVLSHVSYS
jgi:hypothetical protein